LHRLVGFQSHMSSQSLVGKQCHNHNHNRNGKTRTLDCATFEVALFPSVLPEVQSSSSFAEVSTSTPAGKKPEIQTCAVKPQGELSVIQMRV
jgi:hypothetical protein